MLRSTNVAQSAQQKLQKDLKEIEVQREEFQKIMDRVKVIDNLVEFMEDNTDAMAQDVEKFQKDVEDLEKTKETNHPLQKLTDLLDRWSRDEPHTQEDIIKFASELWMTLAEYEKDLKESVKGHEIILAMKEYKYSTHLDWIKNKLGFYMDLYETVMNESKLRQRRDMERVMMSMSDLESRLLTYQKDETELAQFIYGEVKLKNMSEATAHIHDLKKVMAGMHVQMKQFEPIKNTMKL